MGTTILLLGGYGTTGRCLAQLLLERTDVRLKIAGRSEQKARAAALQWNERYPGQRADGQLADASSADSLRAALAGVDLVLVASSTAQHTQIVAEAALSSGADYLDIHYAPFRLEMLRKLASRIESMGRCFITEAGLHPGIAAPLVRYAGSTFDELNKASVSMLCRFQVPAAMPDSIYELVDALNGSHARVFKDGQWRELSMGGMNDLYRADFKPYFGTVPCAPMDSPELHGLIELIPSLQETGFYAAGFNWFVDWIVFPLAATVLPVFGKRAVKPVAQLLYWGLTTFTSCPWGTAVKLDALGMKEGLQAAQAVLVYHPDAYMLTAISVVACLLQYLDSSIKKPGLHMMGHLVDCRRLLADMETFGADIQISGPAVTTANR